MPRTKSRLSAESKQRISLIGNESQGIGRGSRRRAEAVAGPSQKIQSQESETSGSEYFPTPKKAKVTSTLYPATVPEAVESDDSGSSQRGNSFFVTEKAALDQFVATASQQRKCSTPSCCGILVPSKAKRVGLGGGAKITYSCSGCEDKSLHFNSSTYVLESRRSVVSLALAVAFILSGQTHASYFKALSKGLGMPVLSQTNFYEVIKHLYAPIRDLLDNMCNFAKTEMHKKDDQMLGSWNRAVTTADGCWMTRGHFSQNFTFVVKDYLTNGLLYYGHLCMRGGDDVIDEPLYPGTSKSAEGHMARVLFQQAKDEGCTIEVNWQDSDSSSAKAVRDVYDDVKIMHCAGHVGRAHGHRLADMKNMKTFSAAYIRKHIQTHPSVSTVTCVCQGRNHRQGCGCITEAFIRAARINHFLCCVQAGNDPGQYAERMRHLGQYHARGIHQWDNQQCSFHPSRVCSCGNCQDHGDLSCSGNEYKSKFVLTCPLHALAYQIECHTRAAAANTLIHPEMGRGHSNLCEAAFSVLPLYRAKNLPLHRLSYMTMTNWGLVMSCMSFLVKMFGAEFNPYVHIFESLHLPIVDGLQEIWASDLENRQTRTIDRRQEESKKYRISLKNARIEEQEERKQWTKRQRINHSYGVGGEDLELDNIPGPTVTQSSQQPQPALSDSDLTELVQAQPTHLPSAELVVVTSCSSKDVAHSHPSVPPTPQLTSKQCRCGSTTHRRTSFKHCPLNVKATSTP